MSQPKTYLAIDLGGGSGRVLAGSLNHGRIELEEVARFDNRPVHLPTGWHWNLPSLFQNILEGLRDAADRYGDSVVSLGIDTWGVDYGLLDKNGALLGLPYQYRDSRTEGMMEVAFSQVPRRDIFNATGISFIFFNTIYQLVAERERDNPALYGAEDLLFLPDLLGYWLTGEKTQERSIASTSQLYNPCTRDWDYSLIEKLGLPRRLFKSISDPGHVLGNLTGSIQEATGLGDRRVVSVGGHDTASAVAAVPSTNARPAYLSSGTWSLMGIESAEPIISDQSYEDNFTNEVAVGGNVRFLKIICGLWLIQESKRFWSDHGQEIAYSEMAAFAEPETPFRSLIDPDDPRFVEPGKMPEKIQSYCRDTEQPVPHNPGQIIRCIYESLALRYAEIWRKLIRYTGETPETLHIVGGGCRDHLLNQFTANAIGTATTAGPAEATGLGNILVQMMADGSIPSLKKGRRLIGESFPVKQYEPENTEAWAEAASKFAKFTNG